MIISPSQSKETFLNKFRTILESCDLTVRECNIKEEQTYDYALLRVYCKTILTCKEIYILLLNGFPDGAMALSRQVYEAWVITRRLLKGFREKDQNLLERFFDSIEIFDLKRSLDITDYVLSHRPNDDEAKKVAANKRNKLDGFLRKYRKGGIKDFGPFWWTGSGNIDGLIKGVELDKDYMY